LEALFGGGLLLEYVVARSARRFAHDRGCQVPASIKNRLVFEVTRGVEMFLSVEAGVAYKEDAGPSIRRASLAAWAQMLKRLGRRTLAERGLGLRGAAGRSPGGALTPASRGGVNPENVVWIFGAGRSGSTWLSSMMGELEGQHVWFEPWVGALFDPYHLRLEERGGRHFILSPYYKKTWLKSIRNFVLDGANVRFPEITGSEYLVAKEPGGSVGAVLLAEALPESRMVLLVRDPRDYTASWLDARKEGGWRSGEGPEDSTQRTAKLARRYSRLVGEAKRAFDAHEGRKVLVRYEDLRADTSGEMRRVYSALEIPVNEEELARVVDKYAWENIPEEKKGEGKFYRKATPGGWREDLTEEQARTVEEITAPLLKELYPA
jgi:hypothetical protein